MGCDIHTFVEVKAKDKWLLYNQPRVNRNYDLFEKMAGVRGKEENAISPPKGLPKDISESTALIYSVEEPDAHSESYLTLMEIGQLSKWWEAQGYKQWFDTEFGYLFGNGFTDIDELSEPLPIEDVRFVFWFDN
jgi:hypothetical protein